MAKSTYNGFELLDNQLAKLDRSTVRRLVEAGAASLVEGVKDSIREHNHISEGGGDMLESVGPGLYHETLDGGWMDVYPQGEDRHGVRNATKAYVTNYGRGKKKATWKKMGDKFITGSGSRRKFESAIEAAMKKENENIIREANGG
jgi:serine/threonine-protein kinase RIO1